MVSSSSTEHVSSSKTASERELEELRAKLAAVTAERDVLRRAYEELLTKHKLLKHQLFVAKAERIDVTQLDLEFKTTSAALDELQKSLGIDRPPRRTTTRIPTAGSGRVPAVPASQDATSRNSIFLKSESRSPTLRSKERQSESDSKRATDSAIGSRLEYASSSPSRSTRSSAATDQRISSLRNVRARS